ncbi:right-handed parallel beta-helix repeat-containing protein [Sphingomonas lenta]|uniref:Right handed beta helix domain-containing protein n=1 Tax=Sphingomonas lenta TaxID=1141887 RepID=A0A2A2SJ34_9SPHN|nr:right-handed parallel beta-helix repeat-containing protein [Sphingomonas lenta]PAX09228.1 hypothetical protein CKY28_00190 [Sphingomonas lenta]
MKRRLLLAAAVAAPAAWSLRGLARGAADDADGRASLPDFRRDGDVDDSEAFRRAAATGRPVHLPAGRGRGPGGRYLIASTPQDRLPSGVQVLGDGIDRTIVARSYRRSAPFVFFFDSDSADPARNGRNMIFRDFTIEDEVEKRGYAEFDYLIMLNGVSGARFERVGFRGFRGDGLHLGSGTVLGHERHNLDVSVVDCVFDGINANNRNGISVIDCDRLLVQGCRFLNCSRYGDGTVNKGDPFNPRTGVMAPGPIDFEPNDDGFAVIRAVTIRDNLFRGGGGYAVTLNLRANDRVRNAQSGFVITGNTIEDRDGAFTTAGYGGDQAIRADQGYGVTFSRNTIRRCRTPFILNGMRGVTMAENRFTDCASHSEIGNTAWNAEVTLTGNRFERVGLRPAGYALWVRECDRLRLERNEFVDCGLADRRFGVGLAFVGGRITRLAMLDNLFSSPNGRMTQTAVAFQDARIDARTATVGPQRVTFAAPPVRETLRLAPV